MQLDTQTRAGDRPADGAVHLRIRGLTKRFGSFTALDDVSLDVPEGQFVCFLGPSGCGKTTLLRCVAGLETQSQGGIEQRGRDVSGLPPAARDFGIVFQSYALFPNLTVARNIAYGLTTRHMPRQQIQARVAELVTLVGLEGQETKYPSQLSGGQQQRVALARALAPSPGLLLLDEPLSALDAKVRVRLRHEVRALHRRLGITTIMVTHDQEEALTMADSIVVMNQGVIEQVGDPVTIYRQPASAFVADFVGAMNFIDVEVSAAGDVSAGPLKLAHPDAGRFANAGRATLCLRPEDVELVAGEAAGTDSVLQDAEFMGSFVRLILELPGLAAPLLADFSINEARALSLEPGSRVRVALPAARALLFPVKEA